LPRRWGQLGLDYLVVTSVNRDELPDGGASHFAQAIVELRREAPRTLVEVLTPDFQGSRDALQMIVDALPTVAAHNLETVERLTPRVRDRRASYRQSLEVLELYKRGGMRTKSSIMLGLGRAARLSAALRAHAAALVELQHLERLAVGGAPVAHARRQALHRLEIVRRDRGQGVDDHLQRIARALEIRRQHLDQRSRRLPAQLDDGLGEVGGASVRQLVPVHRGDHQVIEAQLPTAWAR